MSTPPDKPKIYHITHIDNLPEILSSGGLYSDSHLPQGAATMSVIGMSGIKRRRLDLPVACHPGKKVGEFVPFYVCPRSVMLYVISRANHPNLIYRGGQRPIIHLQADLHETVAWAEQNHVAWAFSLSNAGAFYAQFRNHVDNLAEIDWTAVQATDFRDSDVREGKQAEFLVNALFPWSLIELVGVCSPDLVSSVRNSIPASALRPEVSVRRDWYY
jgi:hypothetical protein